MNVNHRRAEDKVERTPKYDINRVDYQWIEKQTSVKEMKLAYDELEFDGCFPDLMKTLGEKIGTMDIEFKRRI